MAGSLKELSIFRYERATEELENAQAMLDTGKLKLALNRSYYAIFHAMRAVNVLDEFDSSKHSGVIAHFNQYHVEQEYINLKFEGLQYPDSMITHPTSIPYGNSHTGKEHLPWRTADQRVFWRYTWAFVLCCIDTFY